MNRASALCFTFLLFGLLAPPATASTPAPWPSILLAFERGYRPGIEELPQLAAALADAPHEVLVAWDAEGRFLLHAMGDRHGVQLPASRARKLAGGVVIHNHPSGRPPSPRDRDSLLRYRLARMYVVARVDGVVSLAEVDRREALRRSSGAGAAAGRGIWRPLVPAAPSFVIDEASFFAAQVAYSLVGPWL